MKQTEVLHAVSKPRCSHPCHLRFFIKKKLHTSKAGQNSIENLENTCCK